MQKIFVFIAAVILTAAACYGQSDGRLQISKNLLTKNNADGSKSVNISHNWKFKSGDDTAWKSPHYDDSSWKTINVSFAMDTLSADENTGICWLRLKIEVDSSLYGKQIGLSITERGASEWYLDGKLIHKFGTVGNNDSDESEYNPDGTPIGVYLDSSSVHILAVRYSYYDIKNFYERFGKIAKIGGLTVKAGLLNPLIEEQDHNGKVNASLNLSLFGILASLALLHLFLYFYYRSRIENLYYSIFTFCLSLNFLLSFLIRNIASPISMVVLNLFNIFTVVSVFLFFMLFIYYVFYGRVIKLFRIFLAVGILLLLTPVTVNFIPDSILNPAIITFAVLSLLEGMRVIINGLRKKVKGSWVIGTGALFFILVLLFSFALTLLKLTNSISDDLQTLIIYSGLISLPISMSIYLARDFAVTNKNLSIKLVEVQQLSEKAIEHEKREAEFKIENEKEKARLREAELLAKALEAENERKAQELEEARKIQLSMLPKSLPSVTHLDIAVFMQTATEVGGDYYDFHLYEDGTLAAILGDATGHGVKAGVMVTAVKSMFISNSTVDKIPVMFKHFSDSIKELNLEYMYMCLAVAKIKGYKMRLASAGIPPVIMYDKSADTVEYLTLKGLPLGTGVAYPYEEKEVDLSPGDTIVMMCDGFPELLNPHEEMFGYDDILTVFRRGAGSNSQAIIDEFKRSIDVWREGEAQRDDITFVVITVK